MLGRHLIIHPARLRLSCVSAEDEVWHHSRMKLARSCCVCHTTENIGLYLIPFKNTLKLIKCDQPTARCTAHHIEYVKQLSMWIHLSFIGLKQYRLGFLCSKLINIFIPFPEDWTWAPQMAWSPWATSCTVPLWKEKVSELDKSASYFEDTVSVHSSYITASTNSPALRTHSPDSTELPASTDI